MCLDPVDFEDLLSGDLDLFEELCFIDLDLLEDLCLEEVFFSGDPVHFEHLLSGDLGRFEDLFLDLDRFEDSSLGYLDRFILDL